mgnify:CR=1 FL=1
MLLKDPQMQKLADKAFEDFSPEPFNNNLLNFNEAHQNEKINNDIAIYGEE